MYNSAVWHGEQHHGAETLIFLLATLFKLSYGNLSFIKLEQKRFSPFGSLPPYIDRVRKTEIQVYSKSNIDEITII